MIFLRSRFAWSIVQTPWLLKQNTNPTHTVTAAIASISGLNHEYPSSPQYRVSDSAAPVDTEAMPNITSTTEGRQHIEAMIEEPATSFHNLFGCFSSESIAAVSSSMPNFDTINYKKHCLNLSQLFSHHADLPEGRCLCELMCQRRCIVVLARSLIRNCPLLVDSVFIICFRGFTFP